MADRSGRRRATSLVALARLALLGSVLLVALAVPTSSFGAIPVPERCDGEFAPPAGAGVKCEPPVTIGSVAPFLGVAALGGVLVLVAAYVVLRRQASAPLAPADPGEWWTCPKCGSTNVIGSARCYACGTWQR